MPWLVQQRRLVGPVFTKLLCQTPSCTVVDRVARKHMMAFRASGQVYDDGLTEDQWLGFIIGKCGWRCKLWEERQAAEKKRQEALVQQQRRDEQREREREAREEEVERRAAEIREQQEDTGHIRSRLRSAAKAKAAPLPPPPKKRAAPVDARASAAAVAPRLKRGGAWTI